MDQQRTNPIYRLISAFVAVSFIFTTVITPSYASVLNLPVPGVMVTPTPGFSPAIIEGLTIHPENPLEFDFIIDAGDDHLEGQAFRDESTKLIKYFLATLTVPDDEQWVNLSPYEKDRTIPEALGVTELGRDLLAQDYILKQITASLVYPEDELGKQFWQKIYAKAQAMFGTTNIPVNTFNKVWIVPDSATVYEHEDSVFVIENHLKVMLEEDFLAIQENMHARDQKSSEDYARATSNEQRATNNLASQIVREVIIPAIEKEVNNGENFANLRQIYNSMLLATWYKRKN